MLERKWLQLVLIWVAWTLPGLLDIGKSWMMGGIRDPWYTALIRGCVDWYTWGLLSPVVFRIARQFPFGRGFMRLNFWVHLFLAIVLALFVTEVVVLVFALTARDMGGQFTEPTYLFRYFIIGNFTLYILLYGVLVGICHASDYYRQLKRNELRSSRLEALLAQAELEVLKTQLHPHFLFNTLNSISTLMHSDVNKADRMLVRLSEMLRMTLEMAGRDLVSLKQELEGLDPYIEIQRIRFGQRLSFHLEIEPVTRSFVVPNLLLQPLVENAIRHGTSKSISPGNITIRAYEKRTLLILEVADDGVGLSSSAEECFEKGVGLANTRARLEQLYGASFSLTLTSVPEGGVLVRIAIPRSGPMFETETSIPDAEDTYAYC